MRAFTRREAMQTGGRALLGAAAGGLFAALPAGCSQKEAPVPASFSIQPAQMAKLGHLKLTILYDNVPYKGGLQTDWGFACLVEGLEKTILFDAGRYSDNFLINLEALGITPDRIDTLFFSHDHPDHIGGGLTLLNLRPQVEVFLVSDFRSGFKKRVRKTGARLTEIEAPQMVLANCCSTGEMRSSVKREHALVIVTDQGLILLTGCAHPGVVEMAVRAKQIWGQDILLIAGGFHLLMDDAGSIQKKAAQLKALKVRHIAPSHCTGAQACQILATSFGSGFIESGLGRTLTAADLA